MPGYGVAHTVMAMRSEDDRRTAEPDNAGPRTVEAHARDRRAGLVGVLRPHARDLALVVLALVFFAVAWPTYFITHSAWTVLVPIIAALGALPVAAARRAPFLAWGAVAVACAVSVPLRAESTFALGWPVVFHLALAVCLAAVILVERPVRVAVEVGVTILLMALNPGAEVSVGWMIGAAVFSAVVLLVRWLAVSRRQLENSNLRLARESERTLRQSELRLLAEERNHLARDLHDVVAHQMSMIVVQSQSAPYRLQGVTPAVHAEFDSIAETARAALDEVRGLLGVLRTDAENPMVEPVGVEQIEPTLRAARRSGVDITWQLGGQMDTIDETAGVVLHRVLQESLANAARHAPGGLVVVSLAVSTVDADGAPPAVTLEVDSGPAAPGALVAPGEGGGSGIAGMSARVRAVGGAFAALPASDGGFTVTATVPLRDGTGRGPGRGPGRV